MKEEEEPKKVEETTAQQAGAAAESPAAPSPTQKERYRSRYKEAFPDLADDDEEGLYERANGNLDELDGYRKNNEALVGAMGKNKALAAMLSAAKDGQDPFEWLAENLGADLTEMVQDKEYAKKISAAAQKFIETQDKYKQASETSSANWTKSLNDLKAAAADLGLDDKGALDLASEVLQFAQNVFQGICSVDDFKRFRDGGRYDNDVNAAREEGEVKGRNTRISEDLRKGVNPEGVPPTLPTAGNQSPEQKKQKSWLEGVK
jgi:hypothetical protein